MSKNHQDPAQVYLRRKEKNLNYFKLHLPRVYQILENMMLTRAELVVTPGKNDVDMTVNGKSCYRGLAKEYSEDEARRFLQENPDDKPIVSFRPAWPEEARSRRFAFGTLCQVLGRSPVDKDGEFTGYVRGNVFPSVVFLGCGLGFHIEALVSRANIVNAIVVEREPEKFALSLFTVDWEKICSRFKRKGYSISFAIGFANTEADMRELLSRNLAATLPLYPYSTIYYNHLADVELAKVAMDVAKDVALIPSQWANYDDELMRFRNTIQNVRAGMTCIDPSAASARAKALAVVGSGPSLDERIQELKEMRDHFVIVSAGTALKALLSAGIKPDFQVELDPSHAICKMVEENEPDALRGITLLAVNEINPWVPKLFDQVRFFFKTDNYFPGLLQLESSALPDCNPTCTNAALSLGYAMGYTRFFLFGTDYGFKSEGKDHSSGSVYGSGSDSEFSKRLKSAHTARAKSSFAVPAADGGTVLTRSDYYASKRSAEKFIDRVGCADVSFYNCSNGAEIEGATWLRDASETVSQLSENCDPKAKPVDQIATFDLEPTDLHDQIDAMAEEFRSETRTLISIVKKARLGGRRDLVLLVNELRGTMTTLKPGQGLGSVTAVQKYANQMLRGTVLHFASAALCHGLSGNDAQLKDFLQAWRAGFLSLFEALPEHFLKVSRNPQDVVDDPWSRMHFYSPEPDMASDGEG